jgi:putative drug exporter of the RND superfamily
MFDFLGRIAAANPWKVLVCWIAVAVALTAAAPDWQGQAQDDDIRFLPADTPSVRGHQLLEQAFPKDVCASRAIIAIEREDGSLTGADFALVDRLSARLCQLQEAELKLQIASVTSYRDGLVGKRLISADGRCTLIQLALATSYLAAQTRTAVDRAELELRPLLEEMGAGAPRLFVTGPAGIGRDLVKASAESLDHTTWATVLLVVVVLLLVYRSPVLALIPLVTIGVAVWVSLQLLALVTLIPGVHVVNVCQVFAIVILFGAGTDYCLFLISRYREELEVGQSAATGVHRATRAVGGALAASAGTVICGLGMMGFAEFGKIRCAGPVIAVGLAVGLFASLTLTPALLRLGKRTVFWPQRIRLMTPSRLRQGLWYRISDYVVRQPGVVIAAALVPLVPLAILGALCIRASFKPIGDLSPKAGSVRGLDVIQAHFTAGETGPLTVLLASRDEWTSPESRDVLSSLSRGLANLSNVAEVRSLAQPLGKSESPSPKSETTPAGRNLGFRISDFGFEKVVQGVTQQLAEGHYLARVEDNQGPLFVTRLDVIYRTDPFESESIETLQLVETWLKELLPREARLQRAECSGVTVHSRDLGAVVARDRLVVNGLVTAGVFLILLVLVRRLWLAAYLLVTVLLSYYATLGATALFATWLTGRPLGVIEWRVPFFLFTILVAVGQDYNILLVTRVLQERKRYGLVEGLRRGLAATGGTITACGVIMAGTFSTLMLTDLSTLKQIGFALSLGVLLDTFLVRPLLVPAFILLVWREADPVGVRRQQQSSTERLYHVTVETPDGELPFSTNLNRRFQSSGGPLLPQ